MKLFGLIGFPLIHSFSKQYFDEKFEREKIIDCQFQNFSLSYISELKNLIENNPNLKGLAVTIPYKKKVMHYLDNASENAMKMVACNCIKIENGKLYGFNTDVIGFEKSLKKELSSHHQKALILGTGGAASAVEFVLSKLHIPSLFVSRNVIGKNKTISYADINKAVLNEYSLIVNTTPVGTFPNVNECPNIPYHLLSNKNHLFDAIYNPDKTLFLKKGEQQGCIVQNGYEMLTIQAEANWEIWNS